MWGLVIVTRHSGAVKACVIVTSLNWLDIRVTLVMTFLNTQMHGHCLTAYNCIQSPAYQTSSYSIQSICGVFYGKILGWFVVFEMCFMLCFNLASRVYCYFLSIFVTSFYDKTLNQDVWGCVGKCGLRVRYKSFHDTKFLTWCWRKGIKLKRLDD